MGEFFYFPVYNGNNKRDFKACEIRETAVY